MFKNKSWLKILIGEHKLLFVITIVLSVITYLFAAGLMFTSGYMISLAACLPLTVLALHLPSIFVRIFGIGKPVISYFERLQSHDWVLRITSSIRLAFFKYIAQRSKAIDTGKVLTIIQKDIEHVQNIFLRSVFPLLTIWILLILITVGIDAFSLSFGICLFLFLTCIAFLVPLISLCVEKASIQENEDLKRSRSIELSGNIFGIRDWILSGNFDRYMRKSTEFSNLIFVLNKKKQIRKMIRNACMDLLLCACIVTLIFFSYELFSPSVDSTESLAIFISGFEVETTDGIILIGKNWIAAFVLFFFPLSEAFRLAPDYLNEYASQKDAIKMTSNIYASKSSNLEDTGAKKKGNVAKNAQYKSASPNNCPAIEFRDVSFTYDESRTPVFENANLKINPKEKIAIVGKSGVGKTTLFKLINSTLKPSSGEIIINRSCDGDSLNIGVIGQDPFIFDTTLCENVLIGKPSATDEEVLHALDLAGLTQFVANLPKGLDTFVLEDGERLSGGERKRLALARAFLSDWEIILFDEPFANIDTQTSSEILSTILDIFSEKTVLITTHDISILNSFSRVLQVKDKQIEQIELDFN